jgi:hypothetical protein
MNAKKCKKLRKSLRDVSAKLPARQLVVGKKTAVKIRIWLDFKTANGIAEVVAALIVKDPIADSPDGQRLTSLADIMEQYEKALHILYTPAQIVHGDHETHERIKVYTTEHHITAINHPQSVRGLYLQSKRLFKRVERSIGKARAKV